MTPARTPDFPIEPVFLNRWSPRAYDAEPMPKADLMSILEAARWAPSAFNVQPWRFVYSHRGDAHWRKFLSLLDPFNQAWANRASALIFIVSDTLMPERGTDPRKASRTHSFDTGAAWAQLALQATALGYHAHAMAGIDFDHIHDSLSVPAHYRVEIAVAVGRRSDPAILPENLRDRETPSERLAIADIAFAGAFRQ